MPDPESRIAGLREAVRHHPRSAQRFWRLARAHEQRDREQRVALALACWDPIVGGPTYGGPKQEARKAMIRLGSEADGPG